MKVVIDYGGSEPARDAIHGLHRAGLPVPRFGILFSPMIAAAMSLSSVSVIANALRLRRMRL